jgi:hypothetical protein
MIDDIPLSFHLIYPDKARQTPFATGRGQRKWQVMFFICVVMPLTVTQDCPGHKPVADNGRFSNWGREVNTPFG